MDLQCYIAMTAEEIRLAKELPTHIAWMACHFSPYGTGITNLPTNIPKDAMIILNDRTPPAGHDRYRISDQLNAIDCSCYLLDFQLPDVRESETLISHLYKNLQKPVAVSECYHYCTSGPVLINIPLHKRLTDVIKQYQDREVWLEAVTDQHAISVCRDGSTEIPFKENPENPYFHAHALHCKYQIQLSENNAIFQFKRDLSHVQSLLENAQKNNIKKAVGLYQQLHLNMNKSTDGQNT